MLKLIKKLGFKIKNVENNLVKKQIRQIWANKTIVELDKLFTHKPDRKHSTAINFPQPILKKKIININK